MLVFRKLLVVPDCFSRPRREPCISTYNRACTAIHNREKNNDTTRRCSAFLRCRCVRCVGAAEDQEHAILSIPQTLSADDPTTWARPKVVLAPEYPAHAVEAKITGYVDVDLNITEEGFVGGILAMTSTPKNRDFENAVGDVVKEWIFHETWVEKCRPSETVGNVRVWVDIKDGKGVVSISNRTLPPAVDVATNVPKLESPNANAVRAAIRYPLRARRVGFDRRGERDALEPGPHGLR